MSDPGPDSPTATLDEGATHTSAALPDPGAKRRIGPYRLERRLGDGGMGSVFLAVRDDDQFRKRVALKVIRADHESDSAVRDFKRERQILAGLDHPHIAKLLDGGTTDEGSPYLVMELVDGEPIDLYCRRLALAMREKLELFCKVCEAVQFAHRNLVVHRDLKPGNILVGADGTPKLLDFGIAKLLNPELGGDAMTGTRAAMTPAYASPEQVQGRPITTATDVYALGVILYELLTGCRPYRLSTPEPLEMLRAVCEQELDKPSTAVTRPDHPSVRQAGAFASQSAPDPTRVETLQRQLRGDLDHIVLMALRKEPERRYVSVEAFSTDVRRYLDGQPIAARKGTLAYRTGKFLKRNVVPVAAATLIVALLVGLAVSATLQSRRLARERERSDRVAAFMVDLFESANPMREGATNDTRASDLLDRGAQRLRSELRDDPEMRAMLLEAMGRSYRGLGAHEKAHALFEEVLTIRRARAIDGEKQVTAAMRDLSEAEHDRGKYAEAERLAREALSLDERDGRELDVAADLARLGDALNFGGKPEEAEPLLRRAVELHKRLLPDADLRIVKSLRYLGASLTRLDRPVDAERVDREALATTRATFGDAHPETAVALSDLAVSLSALGREGEAVQLLREAVEIDRKALGVNHPNLAVRLNNLGSNLWKLGRYSEAEAFLREALTINREARGNEHPYVAYNLVNLASSLCEHGATAEAEQLVREAVAIRLKSFGAQNRDYANATVVLALVLERAGRHGEAEAAAREALDIMGQLGSPEHAVRVRGLAVLAEILESRARLADAEVPAREAFGLRLKAPGPGTTLEAETRSILGGILVGLQRFSEAEPLLLEALATLKRMTAPTDGRIRRTAERLVRLYEGLNKPDKAADYRPLTAPDSASTSR